ncbi:glycine-rich domain-containing protein [Rhizobium sp. 22-785-1]
MLQDVIKGRKPVVKDRQEVQLTEEPQAGSSGYSSYIAEFVVDARRRAGIAEGFTLEPILARYCKDEGLSMEIAKDHRREMLRFLALSATAVQHGKFYGMTGAVDELWHTFVIFTRDYAAFCDAVAGRFLHHVPESDGQMSENTFEHYLAFLDDYEAVFNEPAPAAYWPRPGGNSEVESCRGCGGCNGCTGQACTVH